MRAHLSEKEIKAVVPRLDPGIAGAVRVLMVAGIHTFESCEGGAGHAYPEPTIPVLRGEHRRIPGVHGGGGSRAGHPRRQADLADGKRRADRTVLGANLCRQHGQLISLLHRGAAVTQPATIGPGPLVPGLDVVAIDAIVVIVVHLGVTRTNRVVGCDLHRNHPCVTCMAHPQGLRNNSQAHKLEAREEQTSLGLPAPREHHGGCFMVYPPRETVKSAGNCLRGTDRRPTIEVRRARLERAWGVSAPRPIPDRMCLPSSTIAASINPLRPWDSCEEFSWGLCVAALPYLVDHGEQARLLPFPKRIGAASDLPDSVGLPVLSIEGARDRAPEGFVTTMIEPLACLHSGNNLPQMHGLSGLAEYQDCRLTRLLRLTLRVLHDEAMDVVNDRTDRAEVHGHTRRWLQSQDSRGSLIVFLRSKTVNRFERTDRASQSRHPLLGGAELNDFGVCRREFESKAVQYVFVILSHSRLRADGDAMEDTGFRVIGQRRRTGIVRTTPFVM